jgi:hypothetical protein
MMNNSPAAVMARENYADDLIIFYRGKAGIRVPFQIPFDPFPGIIYRIQGAAALLRTVP